MRTPKWFPFNNDAGFVIVAVIIITLVMLVIAVGIVSLNSSSAISTQHQIDRIKMEQLGKGAHWVNYMTLLQNGTPINGLTTQMDGKTYQVTVTDAGTGLYNTTTTYQYSVSSP